MFAQLGDIRFDVLKGFQAFNKRRATIFSEHPRIGTKPRLQRTGEEPQQVSLTIYLHANFCNPQTEIDGLDTARANGDTLTLIMGAGRIVGDFVITEISEAVTQTTTDGATIEATLDITIRESFDPNKTLAAQAQALHNGFAISANEPLAVEPIQISKTEAIVIGDQALDATIMAASVNTDLAAAALDESAAPGLFVKVTDTLNSMTENIQDMQQNIAAATALSEIVSGLDGSLPGVLGAIGVLSVYTEAAELEGATAANTALQAAVKTMWEGASLLNQNLIIRR